MALCLAESLMERNGFDPKDQIQRYLHWYREGYLSSTGVCFDIGGTVSSALHRFEQTGEPFSGPTDPHSAGDFIFLGLHRGGGDDFTTQFDNTFKSIEKTLSEFHLTLTNLVKVNVWLKHINGLPEMEKRFFNFFQEYRFPARMTSTTVAKEKSGTAGSG